MYQKGLNGRPMTYDASTRHQTHNHSIIKQIQLKRNLPISSTKPQTIRQAVQPKPQDPVMMDVEKHYTGPMIISKNNNIKRFSLFIQQQTNQNDSTCIWRYNMGINQYGKMERAITIDYVSIIISGWTSDSFPLSYQLSMDGVPGYLDQNGDVTDSIAILDIDQINSVDSNGVPLYDVQYKLKSPIKWFIPKQVDQVNLRLLYEGEAVVLPLRNPLIVRLTIEQL